MKSKNGINKTVTLFLVNCKYTLNVSPIMIYSKLLKILDKLFVL